MKHEYDSTISGDPGRLSLAKRVAELLDRESAGTAIPATAEWGLPPSGNEFPWNHHPYFTRERLAAQTVMVRIRDEVGTEIGAFFGPHDAADDAALRYRVIRLWGDVLEDRSHSQLKRLRQSTADTGAIA